MGVKEGESWNLKNRKTAFSEIKFPSNKKRLRIGSFETFALRANLLRRSKAQPLRLGAEEHVHYRLVYF